jgi:hypothetical protein
MSLIKNLMTFGASDRIARVAKKYEELVDQYRELHQEHERIREQVNAKLQQVIQVKTKAVQSLAEINKVVKNLKGKQREFSHRQIGDEFNNVNFQQIEETIRAGEMAISASKGIATGISTAAGMWALVSTYGTASTGAAISTLSGVAATNATLAWFGGGAVAAGGGGMALGTVVLGGLVVIPAIAAFGIFNHVKASKKIKEIEEEKLKVLDAIEQIESNILKMDLIGKRADELIASIDKAAETFRHELNRTLRELQRFPAITRLIQKIRKHLFRGKYYSNADLEKIAYIGSLATNLATLIDTPIFDEHLGE